MRVTQFIVEYSRQQTAQNLGKNLIAAANRDTSFRAIHHLQQANVDERYLEDLLARLESADPTPNKQYTQWLARMYAQGGWKIEDVVSMVTDFLWKFNTLNKQRKIPSPNNDIGRYKSLKDFIDYVASLPDPVAKDNQEVSRGQAKEYYRDQDLRIIIPEDQEAACYYGRGTKWCTAATKGANMFNSYAKRGPLYIIIPTQPKHVGEKYQLQFESGQYMDEHDKRINLMELAQRFPQLRKVFQHQAEQNKVLALTLDPREYQEKIGRFVQEYKRNLVFLLDENSRKISFEITDAVFAEATGASDFISPKDVRYGLDAAFSLKGAVLADTITGIVGDDVNAYSNEDLMFDYIGDAVGNWLNTQEFYEVQMDELYANGDDDLAMDFGMAMEGEVTTLIINYTNDIIRQIL